MADGIGVPSWGMPSWANLMSRMAPGNFAPSAAEVSSGLETLKYKKTPVVVSGYHAEVFDMSVAVERERYCRTMLGLMPGIQNAQVAVLRQDLQPLANPDGSVTWKRYLEWLDYSLNETSTTRKAGEGKEESK